MRWPFITLAFLSVLTSLPAWGVDAPPGSWPQWRGPGRDGSSAGAPWPDLLKDDCLKSMWRVELSPGYSGPIVATDRVFVTETKDKSVEVVRALDRKTGQELWRAQWDGTMTVPFFARENGDWIRATPAFDGESLFVAGMRDVLVCLDAASGKERWRKDFVKELKTALPAFGFVASPLVYGDAVFVQAGAAVIKLDKKTGEILWRSAEDGGGMYGSAFSSPVIAELNGVKQLVVLTRKKFVGLELLKGTELWSQEVPAFQGMNILTPVIHKNSVFTSTYGGKTSLFNIAEKNGTWTSTAAWTLNGQGYMSTPVVINAKAYLHLRSQKVACVDLEAGKLLWLSDEAFGKYWSMVTRGDKILALDETGVLYLLKANPEKMEILDKRKLEQADAWAHLAVEGDEMYIRDLKGIQAFKWATRAK